MAGTETTDAVLESVRPEGNTPTEMTMSKEAEIPLRWAPETPARAFVGSEHFLGGL